MKLTTNNQILMNSDLVVMISKYGCGKSFLKLILGCYA